MGLKKEDYIKWFSQIDINSASLAGEKGSNLGELYKLNFKVPNGFILTTEAYEFFLNKSNLKNQISKLLEDRSNLEETSEKIRKKILGTELPEELKEEIVNCYESLGTNKTEIEKGSAKDILNIATEPIFVAIRSSTTVPSKNKTREQDTYLNVKGNDQLLSHIKKCIASLFRKETLEKIKTLNDIKIAIVIQKMIQSEKSGIIYSNENSNILIESMWGFGEGINVPKVKQDKYTLSRNLTVTDKEISLKNFEIGRNSSGELLVKEIKDERQQVSSLTKYEAERLGDIALKIEKHYSQPQRIEFAIKDEEIFILQTEKIKEIKQEPRKIEESTEEEIIIKPKNAEVEKIDKITKTKLKLKIENIESIEKSKKTGLNKIGLLELEEAIRKNGKHPIHFKNTNQIDKYENFLSEELNKIPNDLEEVIIKTSDIPTNRLKELIDSPEKEENPALGLHGIRFGLEHPEILKAELNAISRANNNIKITIPQATSVEEIRQVKKLIEEIFDKEIELGIIIETPASIQSIKDFLEEIDFASINIDNLIQSILMIDIRNPKLQKFIDSENSAILYQLDYIIRIFKRRNLEISAFGESLKNNNLLKFLIRKGINSIIVEPEKAKSFSEKIDLIEKEIIQGTDEEPRKYEVEKAIADKHREELKEEVSEKKSEDLEKNNLEPNKEPENIEEAIKLIEEEKKEYLKNNPEEIDSKDNPIDEVEKEELIKEEVIEQS